MKTPRGFGLLELLVSIASLAFIFGIVFLLFSYSVGGVAMLNARQGVQGDALKARIQLQQDFSLTHFDSVGVIRRDLGGKRRDVICCLSLSNWNDPTLFANNGLPLWDRMVAYYATTEAEGGRLIRAFLAPDPPSDLGFLRIAPLASNLLDAVAQGSSPDDAQVLQRTQVVDGVEEFRCETDAASQIVRITAIGHRVSGQKADGVARTDERFEAVFELDPLNTSPRL